jgi:hypothetical protein
MRSPPFPPIPSPPRTHVSALHLPVHDLAQGQGARPVGACVFDARRLPLLVPEQDPALAKDLKGDQGVLFKHLQGAAPSET